MAALKIEAAYLFLSHAWCVRQRLQLQGAGIEQQAGTSQAGFRFLQLGDVERRYLETCGFYAGASVREGRRENHRATQGESVGGVRLVGSDIDPVESGESCGVKPGAIGEQGVATDMSDRRF